MGLNLHNTNNSNVLADVRLQLHSGGGSGGDPFIEWAVSGVATYAMGIDNAAGDILTIGFTTAGPDSNNGLRMTPATPPVISYNTTHPTGTFDYVCDTCGRHFSTPTICCGGVLAPWHDDNKAMVSFLRGESGGIKHMAKLGVIQLTRDKDGNPEVFTVLGLDVQYAWSMAGQNYLRLDNHAARLQALEDAHEVAEDRWADWEREDLINRVEQLEAKARG